MEILLMTLIMRFMKYVKNYYLKKIVLITIGGSNDLIYPIFKSFDSYN
jgi:hypothetical protein